MIRTSDRFTPASCAATICPDAVVATDRDETRIPRQSDIVEQPGAVSPCRRVPGSADAAGAGRPARISEKHAKVKEIGSRNAICDATSCRRTGRSMPCASSRRRPGMPASRWRRLRWRRASLISRPNGDRRSRAGGAGGCRNHRPTGCSQDGRAPPHRLMRRFARKRPITLASLEATRDLGGI